MLRASQTATRALAPFARRGFPLKLAPFARHGFPLKLAPFARRGFSVWPTSAELKLHSGLLALPASSAARASDRERLSSAFGRIEERGRLYVGLVGKYDLAIDEPTFKTVLERFHQIYHLSASLRPDVDVRVLLPDERAAPASGWAPACAAPEVCAWVGHADERAHLHGLNAAREAAGVAPVAFEPLAMPPILAPVSFEACDERAAVVSRAPSLPQFDSVVVGGTYDRLHAGHKLLLSAVGLVASRRVAIGVSGDQLLRDKLAGFLIEPCAVRKVNVAAFLRSVKPSLRVSTSTLTEPVGIAGTLAELDCIVVSDETAAGGHYCNRLRVANGLAPMEVVVVPTVDGDAPRDDGDGDAPVGEADGADGDGAAAGAAERAGQPWDGKVSSSSLRVAELGRFRGDEREWGRRTPPDLPYVIGVAGGIAAGKSTVMRALERDAGAATVYADELAHDAYGPGTACFDELVEEFGAGVVGADGRICRRALGRLVFGERGEAGTNDDDSGGARRRRRRLEGIVWPAVESALAAELAALKRAGHDIVAVEAAVLFEAGWDLNVDEVWCLVAPPEAQVERVMTRNGLSRAQAEARVAAQLDNGARVARSHVVLMSRAQPDDTAADAVAAWRAAERRAAATTSRDADGGAAAPRPELEVDADGSAPLRERFAALLASLPTRGDGGGDGDSERLAECTRKWWRILHDKHCAAGRHYHTLEHLRNYHAQLRRYKAAGRLAAPAVCELALFFHDAVYDARRADNELQSAQLFAEFCADLRRATDLPPSLHLEQATGLILRTANHMDATPAEDSDAAAFLDCDLHTLGAAPHTYHRYAEGVRLEYAHVDEAEYRRGRAAVLRSFPETNEHLYFTPSMRDEREAMAHANIAAEIRLLQAQAD